MKRLYDTKTTIEVFKELGYEYVSGETNGQYDKITIRDNDGYLYYQNIANGTRKKPSVFGNGKIILEM